MTGFDQLIMGYKDRARFMSEQDQRNVVTTTGIVFPTILLHGQLRARWKKDRKKLLITPFGKLTKRDKDLISTQGNQLFNTQVREVVFLD